MNKKNLHLLLEKCVSAVTNTKTEENNLFGIYDKEDLKIFRCDLEDYPSINRPRLAVFIDPTHISVKQLYSQLMRSFWRKKAQLSEENQTPPFYELKMNAASYGSTTINTNYATDEGFGDICRDLCFVDTSEHRYQTALGYAEFSVFTRIYDEDKKIYLRLYPALVWVRPSYRGIGCGTTLMLACAEFSERIYKDLAGILPRGWTLDCSIYADYESIGGEQLCESLLGHMEYVRDMMLEEGCNGDRLSEIEMDAGY